MTTYRVEELLSRGVLEIGDGYRATNSELTKTPGVPFARAGNIQAGFDFEGADYFPVEQLSRVGRKVSMPGDTLFTSKGTVGRLAFVQDTTPRFVYSPQLCYWRSLDPSIVDPRYLHVWMNGDEFRNQIAYLKGQTDMADYVSLRDQRRMNVSLPDLSIQRSVAETIFNLNTNIDLNRRINQTLETMAQAIFKSWFVDFDPVRVKVEAKADGRDPLRAAMNAISGKSEPELDAMPRDQYDQLASTASLFPEEFVDCEVGEIPTGWELSSIGDEVVVLGGSTPSTKVAEYWDGNNAWVTPKDLSNNWDFVLLESERRITDSGVATISSGKLPVGTVLLSSRAPIGYLAVTALPVSINQGFIAMVCNRRLPNTYILQWTRTTLDEIKQRAGGTTFAEISKSAFRPIRVVVPDQSVLAAYKSVTENLYTAIIGRIRETRTLAEIRDALLPRLLSGELAVDVEAE